MEIEIMNKEFECLDCKKNTFHDEYYMVHDELWNKHVKGKGMLCIACLESRIGRELNSSDFPNIIINDVGTVPWKVSDLLTKRIKNKNE